MLHSRNHERTVKVLRFSDTVHAISANEFHDALVVIDAVKRGNIRIAPTVILNQFAVSCIKGNEIWVGSVEDRS